MGRAKPTTKTVACYCRVSSRGQKNDSQRVARSRGVYQGRKNGTTKAAPARALELRERGLTALEIANALSVSERTVFRYLAG